MMARTSPPASLSAHLDGTEKGETMNDFNPGDIIVGPIRGEQWKFIGTVDGNSYCIRLGDDSRYAVEFSGELDGWRLVFKPFFEEGKTYRSKGGDYGDTWKMTVRKVTEVDGIRVALSVDGKYVIAWYDHEFLTLEEVK